MEVREMQDGRHEQGVCDLPELQPQASHSGAVSIGTLLTEADRESFRRVQEECAKDPQKYEGWVWA
jgi:hypothetical protein